MEVHTSSWRFMPAHGGSHQLSSQGFTLGHRGSHQLIEVHTSSWRFTPAHGISYQLTEVHTSSWRFTPAQGPLLHCIPWCAHWVPFQTSGPRTGLGKKGISNSSMWILINLLSNCECSTEVRDMWESQQDTFGLNLNCVRLPWWLGGEESTASAEEVGLIPGSGRSLGGGHGQPTPVFLPAESHGQRSLLGYSPWGCRVGHDWRDLAWTLCHRLHMNPGFSVLAVSFCCKDTRNWPFLVAFIHDSPMRQMKVASKYSNFSQVDTKVPFAWSLSRGMAERDAWYWNHQIHSPGVARCFPCVFEACFWSPSKQLLWILSEGHLSCLFC